MDYRTIDNCMSRAACEPERSHQIAGSIETAGINNPGRRMECVAANKLSHYAEVVSADVSIPDPNHLRPRYAPTTLEGNARDSHVKEQATAITIEDCYLALLAVSFVSEICRVIVSYTNG